MADTEKLRFKVGLSSTSPKRKPEFKLGIDGQIFVHETLKSDPNVTEYFEFECELVEGDHVFEIQLLNKLPIDTVIDKDGNIVEDMLLTIESLEIDDIELGTLKWTLSKYLPKYPKSYVNNTQNHVDEVTNCVNLGWNGSWKLPFNSPFYIWVLENI